ncbi:MAG: hypothetical protein WDW36_003776 [Sanguina aurantia]
MADVKLSNDDRLTKRSDSEMTCEDWEMVESIHTSDATRASDATHAFVKTDASIKKTPTTSSSSAWRLLPKFARSSGSVEEHDGPQVPPGSLLPAALEDGSVPEFTSATEASMAPPTFRPVARRPRRHFVSHLPVLNLLLPGMLCIIAAHHMLCKSRHPQQQPLSLGSFSSFTGRNSCPEGLCLSS